MKRVVIYDTEIYGNLLLYVFFDINTKEFFAFQISPFRDERKELMEFLKGVGLMIGFNNLQFDYPILDLLFTLLRRDFHMKGSLILQYILQKTKELLNQQEGFRNIIRHPVIPQLDLMKIHHFDNKAKMTSLKALEFVLRKKNIMELPYPPLSMLDEQQCKEVAEYCVNDVEATYDTYLKTVDMIVLREKFSEMYGINMMNFNNAKLGEQILVQIYKRRTGILQIGKTSREYIDLKDVIFPYLQFDTPEFNSIFQWFKEKRITQTKKVFSAIDLSELGAIAPYCDVSKPNIVKGKLKNLNIVYRDLMYVFGTGGIHASIEPGVYLADDEYMILDIDVQSFYPNLGIVNKLFPAHMGEIFCEIYKEIFEERKKYPKGSVENKGLKEALNASYGKSNSEYSQLYDPKYTMGITINGQLSICMLAEGVTLCIPKATILQVNTDGMTVRFPRIYADKIHRICSYWEKITGLKLEEAEYSKMVIRDVNNYLAIYTDGKVKRKGAFEYKRELHQNHSMLIVPKAIEEYYTKGTPIEEFIHKHEDFYDFFKRTKLNKQSSLFGFSPQGEEITLNRVTRYYVSKEGYKLIKVMPPLKNKTENRETNIESGFLCTPCNKLTEYEQYNNVNYDYYIAQANKVINAISLHQNISEEDDDES